MMNTIKIIGILLLIGMFSSCGDTSQTPDQLREEARVTIKEKREILISSSDKLDTNEANTMIDLYLTFTRNNIDDKDSPEFMFQAASLCMGKGDYRRAIRLFENISISFQGDKREPEAYFLIAFIYDTYLDQKGAAEDAYRLVIEKFPRNELAIQARAAIRNLSMTDEELIEMFEKKNNIN